MRISDWSSDVCSSDLRDQPRNPLGSRVQPKRRMDERKGEHHQQPAAGLAQFPEQHVVDAGGGAAGSSRKDDRHYPVDGKRQHNGRADNDRRSEEHTSELQSLMRISYAVFCLKKKIKNKQ